MEKLKIGKIVGTHGLKGELKIRSNSDFSDKRFKKGNEIIIRYQNQDLVYKIITSRIHKGNYLVSFGIIKILIWLKNILVLLFMGIKMMNS